MNFEQMKYIVEASKEGSISRAADNLYVSKSGLSQGISMLESELGVKIFDRTNTGIKLTNAGERVVRHAIQMLEMMDNLNKEVKTIKRKNDILITISMTPTFSFLIQQIILSLDHFHPNLTFQVMENHTKTMLKNKQQLADFSFSALTRSESKYFDKQTLTHLGQTRICIAVGKKSPFYHAKSVRLADLKKKTVIAYTLSDYEQLPIEFSSIQDAFLTTNVHEFAFDMLSEKDAVLYLHSFTLWNQPIIESDEIRVIPIEDKRIKPVDLWCVHRIEERESEVVRLFFEELTARIKVVLKESFDGKEGTH
ncbi:LysR family transcriptional regulator [Bacillus sp. AFS088145]|uniref:LysR family transcriptional regulator n=1 Tax=Bacillus sp. AFS088145 TaxID=2033514 RepID=UPI000BF55D5A|nr:LysR family transcriptional regulator [Bacillus sp. AFS088145]PFH87652.1 hypothetical protein COI44_08525 [Bacillus sp. AFS088145]